MIIAVAVTGCHQAIWDKLSDHEARIAKLEQLCNQLNTNISSLQAIVNAINERDYVKDVIPVTENGLVIGYTISFNKSNPITVYHGKDGENGQTPAIGIKQDEDGAWYWTRDGEWILDAENNKVRADGVSPMLKIEEEQWYISYDNGTSWTCLGKAVGEPVESMFQKIYQDENYVYFILTDGEEIKVAKSHGLTWVYV